MPRAFCRLMYFRDIDTLYLLIINHYGIKIHNPINITRMVTRVTVYQPFLFNFTISITLLGSLNDLTIYVIITNQALPHLITTLESVLSVF